MKYLFFDIECSDGMRICEFGYVITDEQYNVLEREVIPMNPESKFEVLERRGKPALELYYTETYYKMCPTFPFYYDKIKGLLQDSDMISVAHDGENDCKFLRVACSRYGLDEIELSFVDSQAFSEYVHNEYGNISLERAIEKYNLAKPVFLHRSDEDSYLVCQLIQKLTAESGVALKDVREKIPTICGNSQKASMLHQKHEIKKLVRTLGKKKNPIQNKLTDKQLCFSITYENAYFKETMELIRILSRCNCRYETNLKECHYFVQMEEDDVMDKREISAMEERRNGRIEILGREEFLAILNVSHEDLAKRYDQRQESKKQIKEYVTPMQNPTLADLFKDFKIDDGDEE
ncbi:MAG: hypothetical protein J6V69_04985 [Clostridia bacterium]|nr:hypothetical protein [Clostridia bacterium]